MKSELEETAYKLVWEVNHFKELGLDWNNDLEFQSYPEYQGWEYWETEPFKHPNPIIYTGYLDVVKHIDYLTTDNFWSVMSRRMLDVLLSVGEFPHRLMSVAIVDSRVPKEERYDAKGNVRAEVALHNYVVVQTTEHLDIFDYEKSVYINDEDEKGEIYSIDEYVFKVPSRGLPPLFRIKADKHELFVSAEARAALKQARITGTRYQHLLGYSHTNGADYIDVPIALPDEVYQ